MSNFGGQVSSKSTTDEPLQLHDFITLSLKTSDRIFEKCAPLYKEGHSLRSIEEDTGIPKTTILKVLKKNKFPLRDQVDASRNDVNNKHRKHSGGVPYGWATLDGKLIMDAKEQRVIREIMKLHKKKMSYNGIAKHLNGQGL